MANYNKEQLQKALVDHGYFIENLDPQWYSFATQLLMLEKLDTLIKNTRKTQPHVKGIPTSK